MSDDETPETIRRDAEALIYVGPDGRIVIRTGPVTLTSVGARAVAARLLELADGAKRKPFYGSHIARRPSPY